VALETMAAVGVSPTASPQAGDVGIVRAPLPDGERIAAGAICVGDGKWAVKTVGGLTVAGPPALVPAIMWRVPWN
jgi:hypothetical protein